MPELDFYKAEKEIHSLPAFSGLCSFSLSRTLRLVASQAVGCAVNRNKLELCCNVGQSQSSGSKPGAREGVEIRP